MPEPKRYVAKDGQVTWRVRFRHGRKQTTETFHNLADATRFCADFKNRGVDFALKMRVEELEEQRGDTLEAIAADFFTWKATRVRSDRTVADYRRDFDNWIRPTLGRRLAGSIDEADVQTWVDAMHAGTLTPGRKPLAAKSVIDRHALLHQIYAWAM